jgi:hypothetical protein
MDDGRFNTFAGQNPSQEIPLAAAEISPGSESEFSIAALPSRQLSILNGMRGQP